MYPLQGVRVLDLSRVLAGPLAGRALADLGADVVKVEPPEGDVTRAWGKVVNGLSGYYTQQNTGKRNVSVDLDVPGGRALVADLAAAADVVVENFRPGVLAKFDLDWAHLSERNPTLVMLSISGFGQDGPEASRPAYAPVVHAEGGLVARQMEMNGTPPLDQIISTADVLASLHGLVGLLAGLLMRRQSGRGQHVDIAMLHALCFSDDLAHFNLDEVAPVRPGGEVWDTASGQIIISGAFQWVWKTLSRHHGLTDGCGPDAALDDKIAARRGAVGTFLAALPDREALTAALAGANLAWGEVRSGAQVLTSPTLAARGAILEIDDRGGGSRRVMDSPYRFSGAASGVHGVAPYRGEHNAEVLAEWLAADEDKVRALEAAGVLVSEAPSRESPPHTR
jgi:crotonobetainyl-CoA:carnitine CoA-transferase CaiB-like acyl-CoA transferase